MINERPMASDHRYSPTQRSAAVPIVVPPINHRPAISPAMVQRVAFLLPLAATCYSAALAVLIARGFPGSTSLVIFIELALLGSCIAMCLMNGLTRYDWPPILLGYGFIVAALIVSMIAARPMVETLRAGAIIACFFMVGQRMSYRTLDRLFLVVCVVVLVVLVLEVTSLPTYVKVFSPAQFFTATRGVQVAEFNDSGLFNTATSFSGRFSFGLFAGPRTSSIFLEQISNGNFACVVALYLAVRGRMIPKRHLLIELATAALILLTANSRFGSIFILIMLLGYFIFPLLSRLLLPLGSFAIWGGALAMILSNPAADGDNLQGRISFVGRQFRDADFGYYLGFHATKALGEADSGYSYFIGSTTIFGFMMLWLFVNISPRMDDEPSRRLGWGLIFYFFGQLLVSSTSLLSIKTAALLWVMVGCVRMNERGSSSVAL